MCLWREICVKYKCESPEWQQQYKYSHFLSSILSKQQDRPPKRWQVVLDLASKAEIYTNLQQDASQAPLNLQLPNVHDQPNATWEDGCQKGEPPSKKVKNTKVTQLNCLYSIFILMIDFWLSGMGLVLVDSDNQVSCYSNYAKSCCTNCGWIQFSISESVDSLCRDGADAQYMQYLSKSRITSPQTH